MRRAGAILARRSHSRAELRRKLEKTAPQDLLDEVLQSLETLGLLNDAEYAYNLALRRLAHDGWGPFRVRGYLLRHGIALPVVLAALDRVQLEVDAGQALENYIRSRARRVGLPSDRNGIRRLFNHLQRRGYRDEDIRAALGRIVPLGAWRAFDTGE